MLKSNQKGFIDHTLIIAIVVVVAVAGLVYWRMSSISDKTPTDSNTVTQQDTEEQDTEEQTAEEQDSQNTNLDPNEGFLAIGEWGVRGKQGENLTLEYLVDTIENPDGTSVITAYFSSTELGEKAPDCAVAKDETGAITSSGARIMQLTQKDYDSLIQRWKDEAKKVGEYYYRYISPQYVCFTDDSDKQLAQDTYDAAEDFFNSLEEAEQ